MNSVKAKTPHTGDTPLERSRSIQVHEQNQSKLNKDVELYQTMTVISTNAITNRVFDLLAERLGPKLAVNLNVCRRLKTKNRP